ncbi:MAG: helix-turn-helix transcriptional regulator [Pseudomonadota bacterium]
MISQNRQERVHEDPGRIGDRRWPIVTKIRDHDAPHLYDQHSHERAQLVYASSGVMSVLTRDGTWVVPPQQAVWVPAGVLHEVRALGPLEMRSLYFLPEVAADLPDCCRVVRVSPLLRELILRAVTFCQDGAPRPEECRLLGLIPDEIRALTEEPLHLPMPQDGRLKVITDGLTALPADRRPLSDWAVSAGASERTLARLFVRRTGLTFGAWRQRLRLITAVARLAEGQAVTGVAFDLGYDSPSAFIAMFRRHLGAPPGRYFSAASDNSPGSPPPPLA